MVHTFAKEMTMSEWYLKGEVARAVLAERTQEADTARLARELRSDQWEQDAGAASQARILPRFWQRALFGLNITRAVGPSKRTP